MSPSQLTNEEAERLRELLLRHDLANPTKQREFDLAKPPVPPYRHQEYPRAVYHQDGSANEVNSDEELEIALADGWLKQPYVEAPPEPIAEPKKRRNFRDKSE